MEASNFSWLIAICVALLVLALTPVAAWVALAGVFVVGLVAMLVAVVLGSTGVLFAAYGLAAIYGVAFLFLSLRGAYAAVRDDWYEARGRFSVAIGMATFAGVVVLSTSSINSIWPH